MSSELAHLNRQLTARAFLLLDRFFRLHVCCTSQFLRDQETSTKTWLSGSIRLKEPSRVLALHRRKLNSQRDSSPLLIMVFVEWESSSELSCLFGENLGSSPAARCQRYLLNIRNLSWQFNFQEQHLGLSYLNYYMPLRLKVVLICISHTPISSQPFYSVASRTCLKHWKTLLRRASY
jgi:hypothetical protein